MAITKKKNDQTDSTPWKVAGNNGKDVAGAGTGGKTYSGYAEAKVAAATYTRETGLHATPVRT